MMGVDEELEGNGKWGCVRDGGNGGWEKELKGMK